MATEVERVRGRPARFWDWFDGPDLNRWFEGMKPWFGAEGPLRIEQEVNDTTMTIRVEMPGIDPDKDVDITLDDDILRIRAERRSETKDESEGRVRSEFVYGSFERRLRVPKGIGLDDVKATYKDGILQVVLPYKVPTEEQPKKIAIERP